MCAPQVTHHSTHGLGSVYGKLEDLPDYIDLPWLAPANTIYLACEKREKIIEEVGSLLKPSGRREHED